MLLCIKLILISFMIVLTGLNIASLQRSRSCFFSESAGFFQGTVFIFFLNYRRITHYKPYYKYL